MERVRSGNAVVLAWMFEILEISPCTPSVGPVQQMEVAVQIGLVLQLLPVLASYSSGLPLLIIYSYMSLHHKRNVTFKTTEHLSLATIRTDEDVLL